MEQKGKPPEIQPCLSYASEVGRSEHGMDMYSKFMRLAIIKAEVIGREYCMSVSDTMVANELEVLYDNAVYGYGSFYEIVGTILRSGVELPGEYIEFLSNDKDTWQGTAEASIINILARQKENNIIYLEHVLTGIEPVTIRIRRQFAARMKAKEIDAKSSVFKPISESIETVKKAVKIPAANSLAQSIEISQVVVKSRLSSILGRIATKAKRYRN